MPAIANATVTVTANAPKEAVWEVLADFANIAKYTDSVKESSLTSQQPFGVGASRVCKLAPVGTVQERILEAVPGDRLVISIFKTKGLPVKGSETTFSLTEIDSNTTRLTMNAQAQAKGGIFAGFIAKRLESNLPKGAEKLLEDLAASAEKIA